MNFTIQILGNSYFVLMSMHYMSRTFDASVSVDRFLHACFLTSNLVNGNTDRSQ